MAGLGRNEQHVLDELTAWRPEFLEGRLKSHGIRQPKLEAGEKFACKLHGIFASGSGEPQIRGGVHVTDRRAFVVQNRPVPVREWRWENIEQVRLINGWKGVRLGADPADVIASQRHPTRDGAIGWLKLAGAHALGRGTFDEWFSALPGLLARASGATE